MLNENEKDDQVIKIENPEMIGDTYAGEIVSIHKGYVFINGVKKGYETIATNGDVFCPIPENHNFEIGQLVRFDQLNPDKERVGKFRTEAIHAVDLAILQGEQIISVAKLSMQTSPYHHLKKIISDGDLAKAGEQKPLAEFVEQIKWILEKGESYDPQSIIWITEEFVTNNFAMLVPFGVKFSIIGDVDLAEEEKLIKENIALYQDSGMQGQAESLEKEYKQFLLVRNAFTLMHQNNLLNYGSVIPMKYLPELTFAFPVWYVNAKSKFEDRFDVADPYPDHVCKFFSNCVPSREYAWFYQMYNRRTRPLLRFNGRDIMPPNLVRIMNDAKGVFDYVAIMTPYHDVASKEWSNVWPRNVDPLMVGFIKNLPYMFVLGRWSQTGVFPLLLDFIADTANHIKLNKHLLGNFPQNSNWYKGLRGEVYLQDQEPEKHSLVLYADALLSAYEKGLLFPFLRGELNDNPEYNFWTNPT